MPDAVTHPTTQELTAFGLGKLPERAAAAVAAHLESCPACRKTVANVSQDSFLGKLRDAQPAGPSSPPSLAKPSNKGSPPPLVPCPDLPPALARHSKYHILRELGRGGMGVVYQARQTVMNRPVVIKVINRSLLDRADSLERFHREVRAAAMLSHPNIVTAYDAEQVGDSHMLVMEFVPGQSLAEMLQKKGPLPIAHACHFMRQVALGLQHAHERKMVHRDIKPQNLMLSLKNQVRILDFGLAKMVRERDTAQGLTPSDACMGTAEFMAPEQAQNAAKADIRADLYSLGCTLYCLLSGRPPFREDTWMNTVLAHIQKQPQPLTELRPDVPAELWQVVKRLLAKDPAKRYQKPIEVVQALAPFVKPGTKPDAKSGSVVRQSVEAPDKGTMLAADTGQIKNILREVPGKTPPKAIRAKAEVSPFAELKDAPGAANEVVRIDDAVKPSRPAWWKRPGVQAAVSISLTLIMIAVFNYAAKGPKREGDTNKPSASNNTAIAPNQSKLVNHTDDFMGPRRNRKNIDEIKELPTNKSEASPVPKPDSHPAPGKAEENDVASLFTKTQLREWLVAPDKSDKTQGKDVELRDGLIVLDKPGSLLVTKKADFKNVEFTVELAASEATEAFVGMHLQQRRETWGNKTSLIFDNGSKILAGMQTRKFGRNEMGMKRAQLDYDQFFTMRIRVKDNGMGIFVNGVQTSGVNYTGDLAPVSNGCPPLLRRDGHLRHSVGACGRWWRLGWFGNGGRRLLCDPCDVPDVCFGSRQLFVRRGSLGIREIERRLLDAQLRGNVLLYRDRFRVGDAVPFLVGRIEDLDGPSGQRVASPGDLLAIVPLNFHRHGVGPGDTPLDPVIGATHPAANLQRGQAAGAPALVALRARHDGSPCIVAVVAVSATCSDRHGH